MRPDLMAGQPEPAVTVAAPVRLALPWYALAGGIALPLTIAVVSLFGVRAGLFASDAGLTLLVTANVLVLVALLWLVANNRARAEVRRQQADDAIQAAVAALVQANTQLQVEIADRRRAEAAARTSEERFFAMFSSSPAGMVLSSQPGLRYVAVNDSWLRMTGFTRAEVIGKTAEEVGMLNPEERAAIYARAGASGELRDVDLHFRHRNGEPRSGLISTQQLTVDGEVYQFTTLVDITDRVQTEDELRESHRRLEAALSELRLAQRQIVERERIAALGQLASGIAHDFNNTLGPILGYSDLLLANPERLSDTETVTEYLRAMNAAAQGAAGVVSRLRDFYRRRQHGDREGPALLPDLVAQAVTLTRPRWKDLAQANGAMIEVDVEVGAVPPLEGNAGELRDALVNLILNAADAMPAGGTISVRARTEPATESGRWPGREHVAIEVTDNGAGMTDEVRRRCLEPFFTTKGDQGTGLGLSIVHGTLRRHGGTLEIETLVGQGTTMRMRLPARRESEDELPAPAMPRVVARRGLRILLVDDESMIRQVVTRFLEIDEHVVESAAHGREALAKLQSAAPFDLVITDRAMPEMGGDELATMVKVLSPTTPVMMLTGFADLMATADRRPEGVDLVVGKPTTVARLRTAIATLLPELPTGEPASSEPAMQSTCDATVQPTCQ